MANILDDLKDLHRQATIERSHYYVASCCNRAIDEIERLRAALKPFARYAEINDCKDRDPRGAIEVPVADLLAARHAYEQNAG